MIDQIETFPVLKDRALYLMIFLSRDKHPQKPRTALIRVPTDILSRFLVLPRKNGNKYVILLDDVIRYCLDDIFSIFRADKYAVYAITMTRDAELDIDDDLSQSYINKIAKSLKLRKEGNPASFIYDAQMPETLLDFLKVKLRLTNDDTVIPGTRYHNFKDFMDFPDIGNKRLKYKPVAFLPHRDIDKDKSLLEIMRKKDLLLHYPYQSFQYVIDLLREASIDPKVTSIKVTLYRVAKNSNVIHALINAVKNGKAVTVVMELQARFDEEANVFWANRLEEEGARVIFGVPGLKVHSKLCLITRKEKAKIAQYAILGTGNFNEDTAKLYSDHNLFTADKRLTNEVKKIFNFYENNYKSVTFKHLIVSPFNLRNKIMRFIQNEINNSQAGKEAYIIFKLNNLVDSAIIEKLYLASQAGVKIKLNIRGMFSLAPGIPGLSDNIQAINIVDKYLEHTRILVFCNGGEEKYFISSADLMPRNIDRRVEVTCPIYDKDIQHELRTFLEIQWSDNIKAQKRDETLFNFFKSPDSPLKINAQEEIYKFLKLQLSKKSH
ncbi:MAG: polyphosphate kinase 1, partial [Candidatus Aminicenantes bacterium]|nr:polyphosphate kinase 1 [Candidatus Aminicenantes bacterium]